MRKDSFLETPNAIHRRKVLMHVLSPLIGTKSALDAVVLWEKNYGSQEMLLSGVIEFSKNLCELEPVLTNHDMLSQMLVKNLLKKHEYFVDSYDPIGMGKLLLEKEINSTADNKNNIML